MTILRNSQSLALNLNCFDLLYQHLMLKFERIYLLSEVFDTFIERFAHFLVYKCHYFANCFVDLDVDKVHVSINTAVYGFDAVGKPSDLVDI